MCGRVRAEHEVLVDVVAVRHGASWVVWRKAEVVEVLRGCYYRWKTDHDVEVVEMGGDEVLEDAQRVGRVHVEVTSDLVDDSRGDVCS